MWKKLFGSTPDRAPARDPAGSRSAAEALLAQARSAYERGQLDAGAQLAEQALAQSHDLAQAHLLLGLIHRKNRRWEDAADCFNLAACFDAGRAEADYQLGLIALQRGDAAEAQHAFEKAVLVQPGHADARVNLGKLLLDQGRHEQAAEHFERAVTVYPHHAQALSNLGFVLLKGFDRPDEALARIDEAIRADPALADAHCNRGMVLQYLGRCEEAVAACDRALEIEPGMAEARLNRALALLMMGDFARGWPEYEVRKRLHRSLQRPFPAAEWTGEPLDGKTLLVYAEQGLGDEIMFASCLPEVLARAGRCVIESHLKLERLFARSFPAAMVIGADQGSDDLGWLERAPPPDCKVAIGSLPRHLRTSHGSFPRHDGYLRADPGRVAYWRARLAALGAGPKIGLSWRGGSASSKQIYRSVALSGLLPLFRLSGMHFVSLQYTDCAAEMAALQAEHGVHVHHWQEAISDYDETAALVSALDQVVSVQTAVVHLAGALGRPVWAMVPAAPEWRYQRSGERLPWYPTLRLFRQSTLGEWRDVVERLRVELSPAGPG